MGFFLRDTVPQVDVQRFYAPYEEDTRGAPPFAPALMVCLLLSASCVGGGEPHERVGLRPHPGLPRHGGAGPAGRSHEQR